jgi:hypothetical protein
MFRLKREKNCGYRWQGYGEKEVKQREKRKDEEKKKWKPEDRENWSSRPGVGNPFGSAGHIREKLGIRGPVYLLLG